MPDKEERTHTEESNMSEPEIVIVIEGGVIVNAATKGQGFIYRVIDIDVMKTMGTCYQTDYVPDAIGVNTEDYSDQIIKDAKGISGRY